MKPAKAKSALYIVQIADRLAKDRKSVNVFNKEDWSVILECTHKSTESKITKLIPLVWEDMDLRKGISDQGVYTKLVQQLKDDFELSNDYFHTIFDAHWRTVKRKEKLIGPEADRALDLMQLWDEGISFFKDSTKFRRWLSKANPFFNDSSPISYLDSSAGIEKVRRIIGQLKHGIAA